MQPMDSPASLSLPSGHALPALGLGTWRMGENRARRNDEIKALRSALDLGYRAFDTAEMYGEGGAEEVLGEALAQALRGPISREQLFIVSKKVESPSIGGAPAQAVIAKIRSGGAFTESTTMTPLSCPPRPPLQDWAPRRVLPKYP